MKKKRHTKQTRTEHAQRTILVMTPPFQQVHGTAVGGIGGRRPDGPRPKQCRQASSPATLELSGQRQGKLLPVPPKTQQDESSPPCCLCLLTRFQGQW